MKPNVTNNKIFYYIRVKSLSPRQASLSVELRLYDPPQYEQVVGQGPHRLRILNRIVRVQSTEQSGI